MIIRVLIALSIAFALVGASPRSDASDLVTQLTDHPDLTAFTEAFQQFSIGEQLETTAEYTIFAPNDEVVVDTTAFGSSQSLTTHIVEGAFTYQILWQMATEAAGTTTLPTLDGNEITLEIVEDQLVIGGVAHITHPDIAAANGYIHVIDAVIEPVEPAGAG